jgi:hypothetical protein
MKAALRAPFFIQTSCEVQGKNFKNAHEFGGLIALPLSH